MIMKLVHKDKKGNEVGEYDLEWSEGDTKSFNEDAYRVDCDIITLLKGDILKVVEDDE